MPNVLDMVRPDIFLTQPWLLVPLAFQLWMLIDAVRRQEWLWVLLIVLFPLLNAILYFFMVYRAQPRVTAGFELPMTHDRNRVKELQTQIHLLDKAHHHAELGDIYFQQGKLEQAEVHYRAALQRDAADPDFQAHLGQCLLRKGEVEQAAPLLEAVVRVNPKHDYGHTLMAYAEAVGKLGDDEAAIAAWEQVLQNNSYPRAQVQLAELRMARGETDLARKALADLLAEEKHAASFQQKRDKTWFKRARHLLRQIPGEKSV